MSVGYASDKKTEERESKGDSEPQDPKKPKGSKKSKDSKPILSFSSLESWEPVKSTKMDTCARICRHLLTRDDAPSITFEDGRAIFPNIPPPPPGNETLLQETKILIYQEFTSLRHLLRNVTFTTCPFKTNR
jgi:hypothetical protein